MCAIGAFVPMGLSLTLCSKMGVFVDDLVRVEFYLAEAAVSLVSMGEQKLTDIWLDLIIQ
jgi:hypothetical protein